MSILPANIDYIKMSQLIKFGKFCLKKYEETKEQKHLDNIYNNFTKIENVLDDGVDYHVLRKMGLDR